MIKQSISNFYGDEQIQKKVADSILIFLNMIALIANEENYDINSLIKMAAKMLSATLETNIFNKDREITIYI